MKQHLSTIIPVLLILILLTVMFVIVPSYPMSKFDYLMAYDMYAITHGIMFIPLGCFVCGILGGALLCRSVLRTALFFGLMTVCFTLSVLYFDYFFGSPLFILIYLSAVTLGYGISGLIKYFLFTPRSDRIKWRWRWI